MWECLFKAGQIKETCHIQHTSPKEGRPFLTLLIHKTLKKKRSAFKKEVRFQDAKENVNLNQEKCVFSFLPG